MYSKRPNIGPADYWSLTLSRPARENMKRLSSFGFVTVPQSSPDSQHASTGKRMRCSAVTETSVEPGQVEQEPAGLSSTSSMVLPPDCGESVALHGACCTARCALRQAQKVPSQKA